jgi:ABC-2 type transport system ATP-binding protein
MLVGGTVRIIDTLDNLSRPAEPTVHVSVYGDSARLVECLRDRGYVIEEQTDSSLRIAGIDSSQISTLWKMAAETQTSIRRMEPAKNSLDKIFFEAASSEQGREDASS